MKKVAIITARGGSKGVLRKNLRKVAQASLVEHAIVAAQKSQLFDIVAVSTDCNEIELEAQRCGATIINRPDSLSGDSATSFDAVAHALGYLGIEVGVSCLLQPTSPLSTEKDIITAFNLLNSGYDSVVSICECEHHPYKTLILKDGKYCPIVSREFFEKPRQSLNKAYRINGAVYFSKIEKLLEERTFFAGKIGYSVMPFERSIDIDSEVDLITAENFLKGI